MGSFNRVNFSVSERRELWERWRKGESLSEIGRALGRHAATIYGVVLGNGGYSPHLVKRRTEHLSFEEREEISRHLALGSSIRAIARLLCRAPSTISREVRRHGGVRRYRAAAADKQAYRNAKRPKVCLLALNRRLCRTVALLLRKDWSPQQVAGWLKTTYSHDTSMHVSHETIYRTLFVQARGALKRELLEHLRTRRRARQSRHYTTKGKTQGQIKDAISIHERPADVAD